MSNSRFRIGKCEIDLSEVVGVTERRKNLGEKLIQGEYSSYYINQIQVSLVFSFKNGTSIVADGVSYRDYDRAVNADEYANADKIEEKRLKLIKQEKMKLQEIYMKKTLWNRLFTFNVGSVDSFGDVIINQLKKEFGNSKAWKIWNDTYYQR